MAPHLRGTAQAAYSGAIAVNDAPPWVWPRAAYVHVPFCAHHCGYCDFAIAVGHDDLIDPYLDALTPNWRRSDRRNPSRPSSSAAARPRIWRPDNWPDLLSAIRRWLPLPPGGEFTIEANPDSLDDDKIAVLADHGVTRISLGAQSFHPHLLEVLDRATTSPTQVAPGRRARPPPHRQPCRSI